MSSAEPSDPTEATGATGGDSGTSEVTVTESLAGERLDRAVALVTGWSRSDVRALVESGAVTLDGQPARPATRLLAGQEIRVTGQPPPDEALEAQDVPLDVRWADQYLAVISKPAGLVVHPGSGHRHGTLVHGLLARYPQVADVGDPQRPGLVHRLDRGTSGLLVVALTADAYEGLVAALAAREVDRRYTALVHATPASDAGMVDAPIGRSGRTPTRMAVTPSGREARTRYEVLERFTRPEVTLVEARLETGRTHQIRVHFAEIGHPVVGDSTYGGDREGVTLGRPFLHAHHLAFDHPVTGERVEVSDPLPADLLAVLDRLRSDRP